MVRKIWNEFMLVIIAIFFNFWWCKFNVSKSLLPL